MGLTVKAADNGVARDGPIDWRALKQEVLPRLDVAAEYAALGVEFVDPGPNAKGWRACRAFGRPAANPDEVPSAAVNVRTGIYHDSGNGGESLFLFDFALKHGDFGRWHDACRHYAAKAGVPMGAVHPGAGGRIREATYLYRTAAGEVAYAVFRYRLPSGKKTFTQHPPDGRGGWKFGAGCMDGVAPLPYRLPELLAADPGETLFVVEGEKDADRLAAEGLLVTTSHGGCGGTDRAWPRFRDEWFAPHPAVILPDNDPGGMSHARKVAARLRGVCPSVKVLDLPGLPARGDVSDWLDAGGDLDDLGRLAFAAPEWDPAAEGPVCIDEAPGADADDADSIEAADVPMTCLADVRPVPVEWLMPGRIPLGKITLIAGDPGLGKSYMTMDLIARVSTSGEIPCGGGELVRGGSVVLLSAEDDLADTIRPRLDAAGADVSRVHALSTIRLAGGQFAPFDLSYMAHLEHAVRRLSDTRLVIIDPVTSYVGGKVDDNKNVGLRAVLGPLAEMAARRRVAVLLITHLNKGSQTKALTRVTGSLAYAALARAAWLLIKDQEDPARRLLLSIKNNLAPDPKGLAFRIVEGRVEWEAEEVPMTANEALSAEQDQGRGERKAENPSKVEQAEAWLADLFAESGGSLSSDEVFRQGEAKGFRRNALFDAKKRLGIKARKSREPNGGWVWDPPEPNSSNGSTVQHFDDSRPF
jgi:hypothetical protein